MQQDRLVYSTDSGRVTTCPTCGLPYTKCRCAQPRQPTRKSDGIVQDYKLSTTPSYCLIDRQGRVQATGFTNLKAGKWKVLTEAWEANTARNTTMAVNERR